MLEGMSFSSLWKLIKETSKKVPFVNYFTAVLACAAVVKIIAKMGVTDANAHVPVLAITIIIFFSIIIFVLSMVLKSKQKEASHAGIILIEGIIFIFLLAIGGNI